MAEISSDVQTPAEIAQPTKWPAPIEAEVIDPVVAVPAAVTVTVPIVVGEAQVELVPHSYMVTVGLVPQVNSNAEAVRLSTVEAWLTVLKTAIVLVTPVRSPG